MAKHLLVIKADYNDADYVTSNSEISSKDLARLRPILNKIAEYRGEGYSTRHNWEERYQYLTKQEVDIMENYTPYAPDSMDIHTINTIKVYDISDSKTYI